VCHLRRPEDRRVVGGVRAPHRMDDAYPVLGERPHRDIVALPLRPLAPILGLRPPLLLRRVPGELLQRRPQRLVAGRPPPCGGILAALPGDWRRPGQPLETCRAGERVRSSPQPTSRRGASRLPALGRLANSTWSGCWAKSCAIAASSAAICSSSGAS